MAQSAAPVLLPPPTRRAGTGVCPQLLLDGADAHVPVEPDLKHARLQVRVRHMQQHLRHSGGRRLSAGAHARGTAAAEALCSPSTRPGPARPIPTLRSPSAR